MAYVLSVFSTLNCTCSTKRRQTAAQAGQGPGTQVAGSLQGAGRGRQGPAGGRQGRQQAEAPAEAPAGCLHRHSSSAGHASAAAAPQPQLRRTCCVFLEPMLAITDCTRPPNMACRRGPDISTLSAALTQRRRRRQGQQPQCGTRQRLLQRRCLLPSPQLPWPRRHPPAPTPPSSRSLPPPPLSPLGEGPPPPYPARCRPAPAGQTHDEQRTQGGSQQASRRCRRGGKPPGTVGSGGPCCPTPVATASPPLHGQRQFASLPAYSPQQGTIVPLAPVPGSALRTASCDCTPQNP